MNMTCIYWGSSTICETLLCRKQLPTFENRWKIFGEIFEEPSLNLQESSNKRSMEHRFSGNV